MRLRFAVAMCLLAAFGSASCFAQTVQTTPSPVSAGASQSRPGENLYGQPEPPPDKTPEGVRLPRDFVMPFPVGVRDGQGSTYIPMDSWIYPAMDRLHSLGYTDAGFLGLRPWTRLSVFHMLENSKKPREDDGAGDEEALRIYHAVMDEVGPDLYFTGEHAEFDTVYSRSREILKTPLNDSFHLGQTFINDYGRPYQSGFNNATGASGRAEAGRFTLFVRGELQRAPSAAGYSLALGSYLSHQLDDIAYNPLLPQATDPVGPIGSIGNFRILEADLSYHLFKHELSLGKTDHWLGPGQGGAFAWSTNADDIYSFQIDRVEPMYVPLMRRVVGPLRYDFFVGTLGGHTQPNHPWVHAEKVSIHPTKNLEMGFERTVIWGGLGHEPITLKSFLRSFFSADNVNNVKKFGPTDPGARFSAFDFSYRLPYLRNWASLYVDSFSHDDVNPISAPRRAAIRPGVYLSHVPGIPQLDFRVEGASTDCVTNRCYGHPVSGPGQFYFYEAVQQQGTTNKGFLFTDPIGRDDKGVQAWLTYHLSPQEQIQFAFRNVKADKNFIPGVVPAVDPGTSLSFIPGGTTQDEYTLDIVKRLAPEVELHLDGQYERWEAPVYMYGRHRDLGLTGGVTWYPHKAKQF